MIEWDIGTVRFTLLYFITGFGGILFSALCSNDLSVGASTALFGLIGSYVATLVVNWTYFKERKDDKMCHIVLFTLIAVIISVG